MTETTYRERVRPTVGFFIALLLLVPAVIIVFAPINPPVGWVLGIGLYALIAWVATAASPRISIADETFTAGHASIPVHLLGDATVFRGADAARERGPQLDARAYLCIRGALPVVKIPVADPQDPTPYWLVSTRDPERLLATLHAARTAASSSGASEATQADSAS